MNKDYKTRDQIIRDNSASFDTTSIGGVKQFKRLKPMALQNLVDQDFADPEDYQNESPTINEFLEFAQIHPELKPTFSGYTVDVNREDYRVSIDQIVLENPFIDTRNGLMDLIELVKNADDTYDYSANEDGDTAVGIWWD